MRLIIKNPFFATILLKHKLVEKKGHGTVSIDGVSITYDPDFYDSLSPREREAVLCHEALHVSNLHHYARMVEIINYGMLPVIMQSISSL